MSLDCRNSTVSKSGLSLLTSRNRASAKASTTRCMKLSMFTACRDSQALHDDLRMALALANCDLRCLKVWVSCGRQAQLGAPPPYTATSGRSLSFWARGWVARDFRRADKSHRSKSSQTPSGLASLCAADDFGKRSC